MDLSQLSKHSPQTWDDIYEQPKIVPDRVAAMPERRTCANLQCSTTWTAPWRNRRRPIFEDQWGCGGRCVLELVRAAVRRESQDGVAGVEGRHRHRVPLGLLLLAQGWITHSELQHALAVQRARGGRIGEVLVAECGVEPDKIIRGLSLQWSCPVLETSVFSPRSMALVLPRVFMEQFGMLPVRVAGSRILYLGFEDRLDAATALSLEQMAGLKVESGLVRTQEYESAREALLRCEAVPLREEFCEETDTMASRVTAILEQKQPIASKIVRIHGYYWLRLWLEPRAMGSQGTLPQSGEDMLDYVFTVNRQTSLLTLSDRVLEAHPSPSFLRKVF